MITEAQISDAATRLENNKLKARDVESMVSTMRQQLAGLTDRYNWDFQGWFESADDTDQSAETGKFRAAKIAAVMNLIEDDQFGVAALRNSSGANFDQDEQLKAYCTWVLGLFTHIPHELSKYDLSRRKRRVSNSTSVTRVP